MLRIGLTGGIGAGKSVVASRLVELGAVLIDADRIAREVVEPGTPGLDAVVTEFGAEILADDGTLDRPRLGRIVFGDDEKRQALNAIVHPLVYERRHELVAEAAADAVVVDDVPLLVENDLAASYPLVVVVHTPEEVRVRRLVTDRGMTEDEVRSRVRAQASDAERRAAADVCIDNSGPLAHTLAAIDETWTERLVPFERNLRTGERAWRSVHAVLTEPDPEWPDAAHRLTERIRRVVGDRAARVDHIGSTSVAGLPAKDVIDLQVVVAEQSVGAAVADDLRAAGLIRMPGRWWDVARDGREWDKQMACNADPARAVNCHIRPETSPAWRDAVLLRDWLRAEPGGRDEYAELKRRLAAQPHEDIDTYADAKTPWINAALQQADTWAAQTGANP